MEKYNEGEENEKCELVCMGHVNTGDYSVLYLHKSHLQEAMALHEGGREGERG